MRSILPPFACLRRKWLWVAGMAALCGWTQLSASLGPEPPELETRLAAALELSRQRLADTVSFLEAAGITETLPERLPYYPQYTANPSIHPGETRPLGHWVTARANSSFWARGAFPALLWMLAGETTEPDERARWQGWARRWSEPLRNYSGNDLLLNNHAVFRRWYEQITDPAERAVQQDTLLRGARLLTEPYDRTTNTGRFLTGAGIFGYRRTAANGTNWFHAFIDHTPNTEQLLGASWLATDATEATLLRTTAISHILNLKPTMGSGRSPGVAGSWQRAYFDWEEGSPNFGRFLFNEGKQGWSHASTWSRGQAWWLYGCALAFYHTRHPEVLEAAREAARYWRANLPDRHPEPHRRPGLFVPAWDFDYAAEVTPETAFDSSAAAIAAAALVRLVAVLDPRDPDEPDLREVLHGTLLNLTAEPFLTVGEAPEMSLLRHGCYHHPESLEPSPHYDNGLIWGDYFLVDAILAYRALRSLPSDPPPLPTPTWTKGKGTIRWRAQAEVIYQPQISPDLVHWQDVGPPLLGLDGEVESAPPLTNGFWRLRLWWHPGLP